MIVSSLLVIRLSVAIALQRIVNLILNIKVKTYRVAKLIADMIIIIVAI